MSSLPAIPVHVWLDPSCPWAWQTARWLRDLRDRGLLTLSYSLFSLELNASPLGTPFREAARLHGDALGALALARREGGAAALERLYVALGSREHEAKREQTPALLLEAAGEIGDPGLPERAASMPELDAELEAEFREARAASVFGVPTLRIGADKVIYGPLMALAPSGDDALTLWASIRELSARPDFFELKRWPRDVRPGHRP